MALAFKIQSLKTFFTENKPIWITILAFLWAFFGLFSSPFLLLYLATRGWWLFFAMLAIILLHCITFIPCGYYIAEKNPRRFYLGAFTAIILFAILFLLIGETTVDSDIELNNYVLSHFFEERFRFHGFDISAGIFTYGISCIFPAFIYGLIIRLYLSDYFGDHHNTPKDIILFILGLLFSISLIILVNVAIAKLPSYDIKKRNALIDKENAESLVLKSEHQKITQSLSFNGYALGGDKQVILDDSTWCLLNRDQEYNHNYLNQIPEFIDSVFYKEIDWDNHRAQLYFSIVKGRIMEISILSYQNIEKILGMYTQKYGNPEIFKENLNDSYYYYLFSLYDLSNNTFNSNTYSWTFKNASITINQNNPSSIDYSQTLICYIHSELSRIEDEYISKEKEIQDSIIRIRRNDSIKSIKAKENEELKQSIKNKDNHRKAMEQI